MFDSQLERTKNEHIDCFNLGEFYFSNYNKISMQHFKRKELAWWI